MIKDGKFVCSDFLQYEIKLGMLNGEKEIKEWIDANVRDLWSNIRLNIKDTEKCRDFVKSFVNEVYEQIHHVGYAEGYASAEYDNGEEGL